MDEVNECYFIKMKTFGDEQSDVIVETLILFVIYV